MSPYTVAAIPTLYRGRRYRSRLEARWASFFDHLGWQHEYEPLDLRGWFPDFQLTGAWPNGHQAKILVEVKPITEFDYDVADKMLRATGEGFPADILMLVGIAPRLGESDFRLGWEIRAEEDTDGIIIEPTRPAHDLNEIYLKCFADASGVTWDLCLEGYPPGGQLTGYDSIFRPSRASWFKADLLENSYFDSKGLRREAMEMWATASNAVQWRRGGDTQ